jgi:hypothetical protein
VDDGGAQALSDDGLREVGDDLTNEFLAAKSATLSATFSPKGP